VPLERCIVVNQTRGIRLASDVEIAGSVFSRIRGLIGRTAEDFIAGHGLWIVPCNGIHTFGMKIPIDVAYIDAGNRIVKLYHQLPPFRLAAMGLKTRSVLELPAGTLAGTHTELGDVLECRLVEKTG
jgi:uncharacterized protein